MAASFEPHSGSEIEFDDESDESEIEYFDPYGQMNDEVREILLRLAREERAEKIAAEQSFNFDQASNTEEPALKEQEFYGHYSFWIAKIWLIQVSIIHHWQILFWDTKSDS